MSAIGFALKNGRWRNILRAALIVAATCLIFSSAAFAEENAEPVQESAEPPQAIEQSIEQPPQSEVTTEPLQAVEQSIEQPAQSEVSTEPLQAVEQPIEQPPQSGMSAEPLQAVEQSIEQPAQSEVSAEPLQAVEQSAEQPAQSEVSTEPLQAVEQSIEQPIEQPAQSEVSEEPPPPTEKPAQAAPTSAPRPYVRHGYTGLIVNCQGLGLKSVMSPVIKDTNGEPVYGHKNINPDFVVAYGMVTYSDDINGSDTVRAGNNPLVVMAVSLADHNGNPVISVADAKRVLNENQSTGFLDKYLVVLLW